MNEWPRWIERVDDLARRDPDFVVFGAAAHRYHLAAPLSEPAVEAIEHRYGFSVPHDYRRFLTEDGNGGAGPAYGLWPFGFWDPSDHRVEPWGDGDGEWTDRPSRPFPHASRWTLPAGLIASPPDDASWDELDDYARRTDELTWAVGLADGAIPIANLGCAIRTLLIVAGPERGNVWIDDRASDGGLYPAVTESHPERMTFTDLYNDWLDQAERTLDTGQRVPRLW